MAKIKTAKPNYKHLKSGGTNLDTLVQLRTDTDSQSLTKAEKQKKNYCKKAKSKAISNAITMQLVDVKPSLYSGKSVMNKYYWNAYHCNSVMQQDGKVLTTRYCNTRHCLVCNRIRSAKAINGYTKPLLDTSKPLFFVTLTRQSVKAEHLKLEVNRMASQWRKVLKNLKNTYHIKMQGLRKLEVNYNPEKATFNPHYHCVISGYPCEVLLLKTLWLKQYSTEQASPDAQDIRSADDNTLKELFKYFTKVLVNGKLYPSAMDVIFTATKGKRTVQPFGGLKKVSEDIDDIQSDEVEFIEAESNKWLWSDEYLDWINDYGQVLSGYIPSPEIRELITDINQHYKK